MSDDWIDRGAEADGPTDAATTGMSAVILSVFGGITMLITVLFESIGEVVASLAALRDFIFALIADGPTHIITVGAQVTAGDLDQFGILAFAVGVGVIALGWMVWNTLDPDVPLLDQLLPWR